MRRRPSLLNRLPHLAVMAIVGLLSLYLFTTLKAEQDQTIQTAVRITAEAIVAEAEIELANDLLALSRMATRWTAAPGGIPYAQWESDAKAYVRDIPSLESLQRVDHTNRVRWSIPMEGNEALLGTLHPSNGPVLSRLSAGEPVFGKPQRFATGGKGILIEVPLIRNRVYDGALVARVAVDPWLTYILRIHDRFTQFHLTADFEGRTVFAASPAEGAVAAVAVTVPMKVGDQIWAITLRPTTAYAAGFQSFVPEATLVVGLIMALLSGILMAAYRTNKHQRRHAVRLSERLAINERRMRTILDNTADAILTIGDDGHILSTNEAAQTLFGYEQNELVGQSISMLVPENMRARHDDLIRQAGGSELGESLIMARDVKARHKNGEALWIQITVNRVTTAGKTLFVGVMRDITARHAAEEDYARRAEAFRLITDAMSAGVWYGSFETQELVWSDRFREIAGIGPDIRAEPKTFEALIHADDRSAAIEAFKAHVDHGTPFDMEYRVCRQDGRVVNIHAVAQVMRDQDGAPQFMAGAIIDISERHAQREAIERQLATLQLAESVAGMGVWTYDTGRRTLACSDEVYRIFGNHPEEDDLHTETLIARLHPIDRPHTEEALRRALDRGKAFQVETRIVHPDGEVRHIVMRTSDRLSNDGVPGSIVGVVRDVTEIRRRELELSSFVDASCDGFWDWYIQDDYEYMSPRFWEILGHDPDEKRHHPSEWQRLILPEDLKATLENFDRHAESLGRHPFSQEVRYRHKDGSTKYILCRGSVIEWDKDNRPVRMIGTHTDLTEMREATQALHVSEQRFALAAEGASVGIWDWMDPSQDGQYWSATLYALLGYEDGELEPCLESFKSILHPDEHSLVFAQLEDHLENRKPYRVDMRLKHKTKGYRWYHSSGQAQWADQGYPVRMIGTMMDVHELHNLRNLLLTRTHALDEALSDRVKIASMAAQDVVPPLTQLHEMAQTLRDEFGDDVPADMLKTLNTFQDRLADLNGIARDLVTATQTGDHPQRTGGTPGSEDLSQAG